MAQLIDPASHVVNQDLGGGWRLDDSLSLPAVLTLKIFCGQVASYYEGLDFLFVWLVYF